MEEPGHSTARHAPAGTRRRVAFAYAVLACLAIGAGAAEDDEGSSGDGVGHPVFLSPHARPLTVAGAFLYVANTPADTLDIVDTASRTVVARISTGVDPVSVAVRPDGKEVWVANHISDSVSVIDIDPASDTYRQVVATVQDVDADTFATRFDEPVGVAFASDDKAYVALGPSNRVAIVDVAERAVTGHLVIRAQDPRAIAVRGDRLYVIPFESNNQSQLSGCVASGIDGDTCTFDAVEHVFTNNNVLSAGYDADIVTHDRVPDRDLFVFDTGTDTLEATVTGVGTLLYGLAVDSEGTVFVAQADARNVANGRAGTEGHGLDEMENRAFLNQITRVTCTDAACGSPERFDLEPLPPEHPEAGMALATPFGIRVSGDNSTLVVTAAGSDKLFTVDAETGAVLGRVAVGAVPRGIALVSDSDGAPSEAWVLNTVSNTVSLVDVATTSSPSVTATIALEDPTDAELRQGRIAFNDADASSTGTFSCESCHPDGHTDQLLWVLATPECDVEGCTQIPPRLTMPVRGLRGTAPYHWDGIPGDPYGGRNTSSINADVAPNCELDDQQTCTRFLVDGTMATTMCDQADCPTNDEDKAGLLDAEDRDALARFI
ncbi:MAG: beta-propeller fold lactonase family protein, partial [Gammaproteobacteria bacterium]|nr:beta-propeller fold lactonase family protein [Gammaproteobacteria bacterium]